MSEIFEALTIAQDRAVEIGRAAGGTGRADRGACKERGSFLASKAQERSDSCFFCGRAGAGGTNYAFNANGVVVKGQPIYGVAFEGTVHPASEFSITADLGGTVSGITVKVGDTVQKGQPLLRMDGREAELTLQQASVELQAAESNLERFRAQLAEANARVAVSQREEQRFPRGNGAILRKGQRPHTSLR